MIGKNGSRNRAALNAQIRNNGQGNADRAPAKTGYIIDDCYFLLHYTAPFALYCITKSRELQQIRNSAVTRFPHSIHFSCHLFKYQLY